MSDFLSYSDENIFAKILRSDLPSFKVYEDDSTLAFMDIMPQADGHTLVIPKEKAVTLHDLSPTAAADLINKVQMVAAGVKEAMQAKGITLMQLNGQAAGQTVPHIHFHIIPANILGGLPHAQRQGDMEKIQGFATKIAAAIRT